MSWLAHEPNLPLAECEAKLDAWCRAGQARTVVYSIDHGQRPVEYAVCVDGPFGTIINAVGTDKRKVWNQALGAVEC